LRIATSYDVWRHNATAFSISRWFYLLDFVVILGCGVQLIALVSTILFMPDSVFNKNKYLTYLILWQLSILLWLPFQNYSIEHTKSLLFSPQFQGTLAGINVIVYAIIFIVFLTTLHSIHKYATRKYRPFLLAFFLGGFGLMLPWGVFGISIVDSLFGINSTDPFTPWFAGIIFFAPLFMLLVRWIDLRVGDT
jgi:hypothetical protein